MVLDWGGQGRFARYRQLALSKQVIQSPDSRVIGVKLTRPDACGIMLFLHGNGAGTSRAVRILHADAVRIQR